MLRDVLEFALVLPVCGCVCDACDAYVVEDLGRFLVLGVYLCGRAGAAGHHGAGDEKSSDRGHGPAFRGSVVYYV